LILDLSDEETLALLNLLVEAIEADHYASLNNKISSHVLVSRRQKAWHPLAPEERGTRESTIVTKGQHFNFDSPVEVNKRKSSVLIIMCPLVAWAAAGLWIARRVGPELLCTLPYWALPSQRVGSLQSKI